MPEVDCVAADRPIGKKPNYHHLDDGGLHDDREDITTLDQTDESKQEAGREEHPARMKRGREQGGSHSPWLTVK